MTDPSVVVASGVGEAEAGNKHDGREANGGQEVNRSAEVGGSVVEYNKTSNNVCSGDKQPSKGKGLSVAFPDDSLVLGYMEPPNPWKNVPICDTGDLLTAYKKGCSINGVNPLTKVLQQIHGIEDNSSRYEILSLKGEKIDIRHVESLEEIFSRVQFKTLDFEAAHLDDESSVALFDMIEYYESACKLNISFNKNIGVRGWQSCARLIKKTPCLVHLDARNCELNERMMPIIGRSLKVGSTLTTLHLENTYMSGRPLLILVAALKMNEVLQELFLADNKLMPSDAIQLGNLLKFNQKLYLLDLRNNHLQDVGVGHLSDGLYEQNLGQGLNTLVLWNNQITYQGMPALARALGSTESLETLNLGHNSITNEGIYRLKEGLLKNKSLLRIGLQCTKITCEGSVALAEYVADSRQLLRLDLRENDIKTAGLMALSLALKVNETVTKMDVDKDIKKDSGMKDYADQQRRLQMDINNFLSRNKDLALKREEEERRKMEERAIENTRLKQLEEEQATMAENVVADSIEYIPTCTKIRRPNLLFPVDCPQQTLDSPGLGGTFNLDHWPDPLVDIPLSPDVSGANQLVSPPPGELLLSPQYCVRTKAKKLFTVSKVGTGSVSPMKTCSATTPSSVSVLPSALPGPTSPINVLSAMQPEFSQPSPENRIDGAEIAPSHNVHTLIHQIISEAVDMHQKGLDIDISSSESHIENKIDIVVTEMEESLLSSNRKSSQGSVAAQKSLDRTLLVNGLDQIHAESNRLASNGSSSLVNGGELSTSGSGATTTTTSSDSPSSVSLGTAKAQLSNDRGSVCNNNNGMLPKDSSGRGKVLDSSGTGHRGLVDPTLPDLQTNLTINGMTRELASVLDTLDLTQQTSKTASANSLEDATTPDEFERELDAMLASVSGVADLPADRVLHEALQNSTQT
ncbi:protein phosphatase 1 regulatory subunit 37-like isoform X2 [Liolophura sinensis]|uniref:protein phosphatase 1 regulatory subunit 37-like isoform X2 n=1 Tax=Liolophura sinensis TaxID=3198878 RepID=UPI003158B2F6